MRETPEHNILTLQYGVGIFAKWHTSYTFLSVFWLIAAAGADAGIKTRRR